MKIQIFAIFVCLLQIKQINSLYCADIEFCSRLKDREPEDIYSVDPESFHVNDIGIIKFNLFGNEEHPDLEVNLWVYEDNTFRLKMKEVNSTRYELLDVVTYLPNLAGIKESTINETMALFQTGTDSKIFIFFQNLDIIISGKDEYGFVLFGRYLYFDDPSVNQAFSFALYSAHNLVFYGLHQHAVGLSLESVMTDGEPYRLYNLDHPNYKINDTSSIYGAVPFLYFHQYNYTMGAFLHNAAQQFIEFLPMIEEEMPHFMVESGTFDIFLFMGPTPSDVLSQYLRITGVPDMPPLWSLGFHQSRYSYMTQEEVKDVVANFDNFDFQLDAVWLDIDHTDSFKYFTWHPDNYNNPEEMQANVSLTNRKIVVISDPHIKVEEGYSVYDGALENNLFVRNPNGSVFEGNCWPGKSGYIDFLNPEATLYYANQHSYDKYQGSTSAIAGFWNDMNEPEVFDFPENEMPGDCLQYRDVKHRDVHNAYGMLQTRATHLGLLNRDNKTVRPFVLSRSHFAGSQRFTAVWTGDSKSTWEYLDISYAMCLNANLMGIAFCGADVGGFNDNPTDELYQRWFQAGVWLPFFRVHSHQSTDRREPYEFSEEIQKVVRGAIQLRYKHLPVWYTLFHEHITYRVPVIRPLFFEYPKDFECYGTYNEILVGKDILVRAVAEPEVTEVLVYVPSRGADDVEYWIRSDGSDLYAVQSGHYFNVSVDINSIPYFYRAGSIIPRKETVRPSSTEMYDDGYTLYVNLDLNGTATGTLYLDDTTSFSYDNYLEYNYLRLDFIDGQFTFTKIDTHANSEQFYLVVDNIIVRQIIQTPGECDFTKVEQKEYTHDQNGSLLKDIKLVFDNKLESCLSLTI